MDKEQQLSEQAVSSKRDFLARACRNVLAIGAIAVAGAVARTGRAVAGSCDASPLCCFLRGTKIQTVSGERKVEDLVAGDLLPTFFGGIRPIQWIGLTRYKKSDPSKPWAAAARPVRIMRSALSPNVPHNDLYLTPRHAVFIDGVLVPAGRLINGTTVSLFAADEYGELEYFHIKLETHDVLLAEGARCETLLSADETMSNFADYLRRYGTFETHEVRCAPILDGRRSEIRSRVCNLTSPHKIDIIRDRLEERAIAFRCQRAAVS
jgi:hypothetical protein